MMVVDADSHFNEVADTWRSIDPAFADQRIEMRLDAMGRKWLYAGQRPILPVRATFPGEVDAARDLLNAPASTPTLARTPHPAESDPEERIKCLDRSGIESALLFPSFGLFWPSTTDAETADANFAAWNTWIADRVRPYRGRLLAVAQFSLADVDRVIKEIRRIHHLGHAGLFIRATPYRGLPWGDPTNEPVWKALVEHDLPLLLHTAPIGPHVADPAWNKGSPPEHVGLQLQTHLNRSWPAEAVLSNLIYEGVLERYPGLRIGVIEFGASWVPSFLQRLDFTFDFLAPRNRYLRVRLSMRPSEYMRRQVKVSCFWTEPLQWLFAATGSEFFMFSSDFPHPEGNEHALERTRHALHTCAPMTERRFFGENAQWLIHGG